MMRFVVEYALAQTAVVDLDFCWPGGSSLDD